MNAALRAVSQAGLERGWEVGVDTALNVALESIDRLKVTADSHHRVSVIETMGRACGYLALAAGVADPELIDIERALTR
jgi:6-phosphofructokinase